MFPVNSHKECATEIDFTKLPVTLSLELDGSWVKSFVLSRNIISRSSIESLSIGELENTGQRLSSIRKFEEGFLQHL
jgi:hypothetical protein